MRKVSDKLRILVSLLLAAATLLSACGGAERETEKGTDPGTPAATTAAAQEEKTTAAQEEKTTAASEAATEAEPGGRAMNELRSKAVAYMKEMSSVIWIPEKDFKVENEFIAGQRYKGLPYTNVVDSSLEEFLSKLEKGIYVGETTPSLATGVDCSSSMLAAWNTVITDCKAVWSRDLVPGMGYGSIQVGEYKLPDTPSDTAAIIKLNDRQTMYRAYAQVIPADLMMRYASAGHCRLVSQYPKLSYLPDGSIDGDNSFVIVTEITATLAETPEGYLTTWRVDEPYSFTYLYDSLYVPLTTAELDAGEAKEVTTVFTDSFDGVDLAEKGLPGRLTCNYRMFEVVAEVKDAAGKTVRQVADYPVNNPDNTLVMFSKIYKLRELNEGLDLKTLPAGQYTLTLSILAAGSLREIRTVSFTR